MKYMIIAPNKEYSGISAGVPFVNGTATTESENAALWFESKGYAVELIAGQPFVVGGRELGKVEEEYIIVTDADVIAETLETSQCIEAAISEIKTMKTDELVAIAADLGIDISECKKVDEKREAIISCIKAKNTEPKAEATTQGECDKLHTEAAEVQSEPDAYETGADEE